MVLHFGEALVKRCQGDKKKDLERDNRSDFIGVRYRRKGSGNCDRVLIFLDMDEGEARRHVPDGQVWPFVVVPTKDLEKINKYKVCRGIEKGNKHLSV